MEASCYGNPFASLPQIFVKYVRIILHADLSSKTVVELMTPVDMQHI